MDDDWEAFLKEIGLIQPDYLTPPSEQLKKHAADLYARAVYAEKVPAKSVALGAWKPVASQCHDNVAIWVKADRNFAPVTGWLYFDLDGKKPFVRFTAHSVVRAPDGSLWDI